MKNLLLAGLLAAPMALVACQSEANQAAVEPAETSTMILNVTGMT